MEKADKKQIPLSVPNLDLDILDNIRETIETGWVSTDGRFIQEFEEGIARYCGIDKLGGGVKSFQSGTAALHLALLLLGVEVGDEVICPTLTFIATVNPIKYLGADPVFMDCDDSLNMDPEKVEEFLETQCDFVDGKVINRISGKQIKGMIVVHIFGNPANMERLMEIKEKYNLFLIEDAAEALGSYYTEGKYAGRYCGTIGDAGVYSFNANKIITAGSGGCLVSMNHDLLDAANLLGVQAKTDPWRYIHDDIGYNYRMTNIAAAFGVSQLFRLESFIQTKHRNYEEYKQQLESIEGLELLPFEKGTRPNKWFYSVMIHDEFGMDRETLMTKLMEDGVCTRPIWGLIHEQKPYEDCISYKIEKAKFYGERILNFPCSTNLSQYDLRKITDILFEMRNNG